MLALILIQTDTLIVFPKEFLEKVYIVFRQLRNYSKNMPNKLSLKISVLVKSLTPGPEAIKFISYSTQLSMKYKMSTIVAILTFFPQ